MSLYKPSQFYAFCLFCCYSITTTAAELPNLNGIWTGALVIKRTQCEGLRRDGIRTNNNANFLIFKHDGNQFKIVLDDVLKSTGTAKINKDGSFKIADLSGAVGKQRESYEMLGQVKLNKIDFIFTGRNSDIRGDICQIKGTGRFYQTELKLKDLLDPAEEQGHKVTKPARLIRQVAKTRGVIGRRLKNTRRGNNPKRINQPAVTSLGDGLMFETNMGLNAGEGFTNIGLWTSYSRTEFDNDFITTKYDGHTDNFFIGMDKALNQSLLLGIAFGYEKTKVDTTFNQGEEETDGLTIAPYLGYSLNEHWSFDLSAGYSDLATDEFRISLDGTKEFASVDAQRWFLAGNINSFWTFDALSLSAYGGLLLAASQDETTVEASGRVISGDKTSLVQYNIGGEVAYFINNLEPFLNVTYNYDSYATEIEYFGTDTPDNDNNDLLVGFGARYYNDLGFTLMFEYNQRLNRADIDEKTITFNARWDF